MGSPGIYDTPPWQLPMDNPRWKPNPYGGGTPESQRTDAREYIAEKAQELAKQRAAQRGGGPSYSGVGGGLSGDTSSYMNSMLTALAYGKGQTYRDQYGPQAMAAQGAFNKPGANVPGHYWSFNPVAQGYKIQKLPQKCPYCNKMQAKRISVGLYICYNCKSKFTGKAYSVEQKIVTKELPEDTVEEIQEFEEEIIEGDS